MVLLFFLKPLHLGRSIFGSPQGSGRSPEGARAATPVARLTGLRFGDLSLKLRL